jgi:hypothetical protein
VKITNYIRAGYSGLYIVSAEEQRVEAEIKAIAESLKFDLFFWGAVDGLINASNGGQNNAIDPLDALQAIEELKEKSIILLNDFHLHLDDPNPILISKFKQVLLQAKTQNKTLIILGCRLCIPPELERELTVIDFALPGPEELGKVLDGIIESAVLKNVAADAKEQIIASAKGLTTIEAENAFALSVVQCGTVNPAIVYHEKAQALKKNGILEVIQPAEDLNSIGGLDVLKSWLLSRKNAFSKRANEYGLPSPKGVLVMGIAGTGKSLTAKAIANVFNVPLLKLDAGKIFGSLVGSSEANMRTVIQTAEAIAPCCLWIDELEKGFSGTKSSGSTDGGTSARVFGSLLNWLQEKQSPVFVVATANDVSQLPPELLRKGRWDELFFVDLPNEEERRSIWSIQIQKYGRDPKDFDLDQLARASDGMTGAEIESAFVEALYAGFDQEREPTELDIARVLTATMPLSKLMAEQVNSLRAWAKGRARFATSAAACCAKARKLAA